MSLHVLPAQPLFSLQAVGIRSAARWILRSIDFECFAGQRIVLQAPTGSGKSTLLRAIVGLRSAGLQMEGKVIALGKPLRREADFVAWRRQAGLLFQDPDDQLFHHTVCDDIDFGPRLLGLTGSALIECRRDALRRFGIEALENSPISTLSGGQKRLVALAGLMAMRPKLLLLDEPSTGLDQELQVRVIGALTQSQSALLIATHDEGFASKIATRRVQLKDGGLIEAC